MTSMYGRSTQRLEAVGWQLGCGSTRDDVKDGTRTTTRKCVMCVIMGEPRHTFQLGEGARLQSPMTP